MDWASGRTFPPCARDYAFVPRAAGYFKCMDDAVLLDGMRSKQIHGPAGVAQSGSVVCSCVSLFSLVALMYLTQPLFVLF